MDTRKERVGMQDQYRTSREREIRQISSQIDMQVLRAHAMGQDSQADTALQDAIAKRDQVVSDLTALAMAPASQWAELRARIDVQIDELEKSVRTL